MMDLHLEEDRQKGRSPETISTKAYAFATFVDVVPQLPCGRADIVRWLGTLTQGDTTRNTYYRQVRTLLHWAEDSYEVPCPRLRGLAPQPSPREPYSLSDEDLARLLEVPTNFYDATLLKTLIMTGMRAGELCSMTQDSLFDDHVDVVGKTGPKTYNVPPWLVPDLRRLGRTFIFYDRLGQQLDRRGVGSRITRMVKAAGLEAKHIGPHLLRNTFAQKLMRETGNIDLVRQALNQTDLDSTQIYAQTQNKEVKAALQQSTLWDLQRGGK